MVDPSTGDSENQHSWGVGFHSVQLGPTLIMANQPDLILVDRTD
jgi:hypothetical protein